MAIMKKPYELSVWDETLGEKGQKEEIKRAIIGTHDMVYEGKARGLKLQKKLNGTHVLTFSMPSSFFSSKEGKWIHNEFCDYVFNERKLKLKCQLNERNKPEWLEFYVKTIVENKQHNSIMYDYTCQDAFIDELSRNGYEITFDTELYNNVEELGTFTETILEDSIWEYDASLNTGDFMEYSEERLFRIPINFFINKQVKGYKINFYDKNKTDWPRMTNPFTDEERPMSLADDYARQQQYFWDCFKQENSVGLIGSRIENIENDGYIYVPYNQLDFCYTNDSSGIDYKATEKAKYGTLNGINSYYLAPSSLNPETLIQFIAIPQDAEVKIDEAQLLMNTDYSYVMKVSEWNEMIHNTITIQTNEDGTITEIDNEPNNYWYKFETPVRKGKKRKYITQENFDSTQGNKIVTFDGYLTELGGVEINTAKSISITDRTEINISEDIDQYVKVYNNKSNEYRNEYTLGSIDGTDNTEWSGDFENYRVCSKQDTRQIMPQLARNLIQNGTNISKTDGWEAMCPNGQQIDNKIENVVLSVGTDEATNEATDEITNVSIQRSYLQINSSRLIHFADDLSRVSACVINFGLVGQEVKIVKNKIYCLKFDIEAIQQDDFGSSVSTNQIKFIIGDGTINSVGDYSILSSYSHIILQTNPQEEIITKEDGTTEIVKNEKIRLLSKYLLISFNQDYNNPYFVIDCGQFKQVKVYDMQFFEAYTKGQDFFNNDDLIYRYSGRDLTGITLNTVADGSLVNAITGLSYLDITDGIQIGNLKLSYKDILFETDVMEGDTYEYTRYFIQQLRLKTPRDNIKNVYDTFLAKEYISDTGIISNNELATLPLPSTEFTEDDYEIVTNYIDLNKCQYYNAQNLQNKTECKLKNGLCLYQRYGYCPYRFQTEKHCRKIRTLNGEKSNRFNLTQELGKVFEVYPVYYIEHTENGKITVDKENKMNKKIFYMTEKGSENKLGFRYKKNLSNISRTRDSSQIVTKLYVEDVDSELSKTGLCSIKTAEDNPSKDSFIIDFSYYYLNGMLNKETTEKDLYGENDDDMGYLKQLGYYNSEYDKLSNQIINLQDESFTELEANIEVNLTGMETAMQEMNKTKAKMSKYASVEVEVKDENGETIKDAEGNPVTKIAPPSQTYLNYQQVYEEQQSTLLTLLRDTFSDNETQAYVIIGRKRDNSFDIDDSISIENLLTAFGGTNVLTIQQLKEIIDKYHPTLSVNYGMLAQYLTTYQQIQQLKRIRASYLKKINEISLKFYQKYEPYLKEGTWSDSNYLTDNAYYHGAVEVAKQGAIPKYTYSITAIDLGGLDIDYVVNVADTTYVEDEEMFGTNQKTGLPNRLKVIISGITYDLDIPSQNSLEIQNYTTQFEDLFQQVSASVQSLSFNENIYKRSSNFTSTQNIAKDSLQGTLLNEEVTLLQTQEKNIVLDSMGQSGSDINNHNNKYKLNGQGLFFSNDGGQHWNTGVGPGGINADYIKVGTLDAGKIKIVDNNYLYFLWDKNGITAYRDPQENTIPSRDPLTDYCQFNKYGLSLFEEGKIKLRAGYAIVTETNNDTHEKVLLDKQGEQIGFFLYDNNMNIILSATNETGVISRLSLAGEIFATNKILREGSYNYSDCIENYENKYFNKFEINNTLPEETKSLLINNGEETLVITINAIEYTLSCTVEQQYFYYSTTEMQYRYDSVKIYKNTNENDNSFETIFIYENNCYNERGGQDFVIAKNIIPKTVTLSTGSTSTTSGFLIENGDNNNKSYTYRDQTIYWVDNTLINTRKGYLTQERIGQEEGQIGIFINNQDMGRIPTEDLSQLRIFSCVSVGHDENNQNIYNNLLTILGNGVLQMGGRIIQQNIDADKGLNNLSNRITIDSTNYNTIRCENGNITLNGNSLQDSLSEMSATITRLDTEIGNCVKYGNTINLLQHGRFKITAIQGSLILQEENDPNTKKTYQIVDQWNEGDFITPRVEVIFNESLEIKHPE